MVSRLMIVGGFAVATCLAPGCGSSGPEMARVSGKITYNGQPVTKGLITYASTTPGGRNATGLIGTDGSFKLQTENPGDGAIVGEYKVAITTEDASTALDYIPNKPVVKKPGIPEKYAGTESSGLKKNVERGGNTHNFELKD